MPLTNGIKQSGSGIAALYRRYGEWLVSITWKRFIVLSLLLLFVTGILSSLPPFNWDLATRTTRVPASRNVDITVDDNGVRIKPKRKGSHAPEITIDEHGVRIKREGDPASGPQEIIVDEHGVRRGPDATQTQPKPPTPPAAPSAKDEAAGVAGEITQELAQDIRREVIDAIGEMGDEERVVHVESLQRQVVEARMAAMQAQVEPHFLFNTLASIDHLIEVDPPRASRMQKNLIALLRASMPAMRDKATHLGRELEVVRPYLEILKVRMEERLQAQVDVPEGLYSADFPPMMLQSLVENAIKHGLEPKAEGGSLSVSAEVAHGKLHVSVADTGVGFARAATAGTGTGLSNIRERLKLIYGDAAELRIAPNAPTGTRVAIVVPYKAT